jgi:hypothetical protein
MTRLSKVARGVFRYFPENPYPSSHPWNHRHYAARPRG